MWTPIAATFAPSTQTPVAPGSGPDAEFGQRLDQNLFQRAQVGDHVALPFAQIENRIADDLAGTVIGHVAAAIGVVQFDSRALQALRDEPADFRRGRCGPW